MFAALVFATVGAFFVTTRLKRSTPVIEQLTFRRSFSPNGDGRFDAALFAFRLRRTDEVTVAIVNRDGDEVRTLAADVLLQGGRRHRFRWDGRNEAGRVAPDGEYHLRVGLRRQGRSVTSGRKLFVDTVPPRPVVRYVSPDSISPDGAGGANSATLRFAGPSRRARLLVYRTDRPPAAAGRHAGDPARRVDRALERSCDAAGAPLPQGRTCWWCEHRMRPGTSGRRGSRRAAPRCAAIPAWRCATSTPMRPRRSSSRGGGPRSRSGRTAAGTGGASGASARRGSLDRGTSGSPTLAVPVRLGRSGVAMLTVRVGQHRYTTPFAVQGRRRERVLVVLPDATWQARNRLETNGDGYPDLLPEDAAGEPAAPVRGQRPAAGLRRGPVRRAAVPRPGAASLRHHDGRRAGLTARRRLDRYTGILYAGAPRFSPIRTQQLLRGYVNAGGRLAWVGRGGFDWSVEVAGRSLLRGRRTTVRALFGERLRYEREAVPVAVLSDRIGFFRGVPGSFGPFGPLEESQRLPPGARLLASAGTGESRRALVVYRTDGGVVARVGIDGFGRALRTSPAAARIMRRLWALLSR